jgi:hypothetical protein
MMPESAWRLTQMMPESAWKADPDDARVSLEADPGAVVGYGFDVGKARKCSDLPLKAPLEMVGWLGSPMRMKTYPLP